MFLPATKVSSSPALTFDVALSALSSLLSLLSPRVAFQYELFTALATVVALTSFLPSSAPGCVTLPLLTVKSVVETSGNLAFNLPPSFTIVVPSTLTSTS